MTWKPQTDLIWTPLFHYSAYRHCMHASRYCTVVTFLLYLGQKVSLWVLLDIICHSLFNVIKYAMTKYYKYKISGSHLKIVKFFFASNRVWTRDLDVMRPACYQKALETCCYNEGIFMEVNKTVLKQLLFWRFLQYSLPNFES